MNISVVLKELAKLGVIALTEESVKSFVEVKIKPIFANWGKEESRYIELEECLSEYLLRCYAKNNIMATIVFGRLQKTLEDLYIPLTLEEYRNENQKWVIDEKCYDILDNYSRILIVDMAGMGKSTLVKYFACQGVNLDKYIPIVIELRRLDKNQSILEYIQTEINSLDKNIKTEEIVGILKKGDFAIFFDGYDEIANEIKSDVLDAIQEFTSKATNTKIVITSREEDDLNSLGEYKCVNIKPLTKEEAYELIKKYDNDGEISKKLIKRLNDDSSMDILKEFLKNPLLVSLLYKTFEYKEEIPYKKIDFYEQVYVALFNDHDKTKGGAYVHEKKTKLDRYQFEQILRAFGFLCLKIDKVDYSNHLIHHLLEQAIKRFSWLKISIDDFLYDITHAVPFIQKDGNDYKWVHKSFMEYFASCFICYDNKELEDKHLKRMATCDDSMKYFNVLDFCYDIDGLGFRRYAILPFLKDYIEIFNHHFNCEYFKDFDKSVINIAKHIMALKFETYVIYLDICCLSEDGIEKNEKRFSMLQIINSGRELFEESKMDFHGNNTEPFLYACSKCNAVIYKLMMEKMPDLYDRFDFKSQDTPLIPRGVKIKLNDDVTNPINEDKNKFKIIVENMFSIIFNNNLIFNLNKIKKLEKEIELEKSFVNDDIFEL